MVAVWGLLAGAQTAFVQAQSPLPDNFNPSPNGYVYALAVQRDGRIVVGGGFTTLGGQSRNRLGRLDADGTLDTQFDPGADDRVFTLAVQPDGKLLVGGDFTQLGGQPRNRIARLNLDGTLDAEFNPGADGRVGALVVQPDGEILVGGDFTTLGGQTRARLGRLNPDGSVDLAFNPRAEGSVRSLTLQPDGKILVAGQLSALGGEPRYGAGRLNPDGSLDTAFANPGVDGSVQCMAVQPDGKILVGGSFTRLGGHQRGCIARLNANGTVDPDFNPGANSWVASLATQADGKILLGGVFSLLGGQPRNYLARLNADGSLDGAFNPGANADVYALAVQPDGKVLVGGAFTLLGGQMRGSLGRVPNTEPATQSLGFDGANAIWQRGGTIPEIRRARFDLSTNGSEWLALGDGSRVAGGWRLAGVTFPAGGTLRAAGLVVGGYCSASSWLTEAFYGKPVFLIPPASQTNDAGATVTFSVAAHGSDPLGYQWFRDDAPLADGANLAGATASVLKLGDVRRAEAGDYRLVVSNGFGVSTSAVARLTVIDPVLLVQPTGQNRELGQSVTLSATATGTGALTYQWWKDGVRLAGRTEPSLTLTNLQGSDAGSYSVVVSSAVGSLTSKPALLSVNLATADPGFNPSPNAYPEAVVVQTDGRILVAGQFTMLGGESRRFIARLEADGTVAPTLDPENQGISAPVACLAVQADGGVLVGGGFGMFHGYSRGGLARLNPDLSVDPAFNPAANNRVLSVVVQPDGRILIGGAFTQVAGQPRRSLARLHPNGSLDESFNTAAEGWVEVVNAIALQPDGRILVGGGFDRLGGQPRSRIGRLNADGTLDPSFNPGAGGGGSGSVLTLAVQADGRILVGGEFTRLAGQPRRQLGRLNADGTLDEAFDTGANGLVYSFALQADGGILVGGRFTELGGQPRPYLARLEADGTVDGRFNPSPSSVVYALTVQADGQVLVGGDFTNIAGQPRRRFARLANMAPGTQSLSLDGSMVIWRHGGAAPETWRASFDVSSNGRDWTKLGEGTRLPGDGGWQFANAVLPANGTVRARGYISGGLGNGSSWFVEAYAGAPILFTQPVSRTNEALTTATFEAEMDGTGPFTCRWFKDGELLEDAFNLSGTTTPTLTIAQVLGADAGQYHVEVTNGYGRVASAAAQLTVIDPAISVQPADQLGEPGRRAIFSVTAAGTAPLSYQWWKDGLALSWARQASLIVTNPQAADAGRYSVVVSNRFGEVASQPAELRVNLAGVDDGFNPGADSTINALAVQADGKILVGGWFHVLAGEAVNGLGRLNPDGSLDREFRPEPDVDVSALAVQPDQRILVAGGFQTIGGQPRRKIARLQADGTVDASFNLAAGPDQMSAVYTLALQDDGKVLAGGNFDNLGGQSRSGIVRFLPDGAVDGDFNPQVDGLAEALAIQPDGKILLGGLFWAVGGQPRNHIARLNPDGTLDPAFNPGTDWAIQVLAVQPDGKILVGGRFTSLVEQTRSRIGRLNADGSLDTNFDPGADADVVSLALQADGKILVGGWFTTLGGSSRNYFGRLHADGTLDSRFDPGAEYAVTALALQGDGDLLVGGRFSEVGGLDRGALARLNNTEPGSQSLTYDGGTVVWQRGGSVPEVWRVTFDYSLDGSDWSHLGAGNRTADGWQLTSAIVPRDALLRARGYTVGGYANASGWFVEGVSTNWIGPDLQVLTWNTPLQAEPGSQVGVSWTIRNRGRQPATTDWVDRVYLAPGPALDLGRLVGEFPASGPLATNSLLNRGQWVVIPSDLVPNKDYWWIVVTDAGNAMTEENKWNNTRVSDLPMRVLPPLAPNLRVLSVETADNLVSGQPVTVTWSVTNAGAWSTGAAPWADAVYLSATPELDADALLLGRVTCPQPLGPDEGYTNHGAFMLGPEVAGSFYLIIQADADQRVEEGGLEADNTSVLGLVEISLAPPPDLQVAAIELPADALSGADLNISWTVTNAGAGPTAVGAWHDDVYLSPTPDFGTDGLRMGSFAHVGALAPGESYSALASLPLPASLTGSFYVVVATDSRRTVFEASFETNNWTASSQSVSIALTPPPDLAVRRVEAPASALASHALVVTYVVANQGADTLFSFLWEDRLYLTTNLAAVAAVRSGTPVGPAVFNAEPQFTVPRHGILDAGQTYTNAFVTTLPDGLSGPYFAIVETDSAGGVFELVRTNNLMASPGPITVTSRPADLVVTSLIAPSSIQAGNSMLVSWSVRNDGLDDTAVSRWSDQLVLSADATPGNADDLPLLTLEHAAVLARGTGYGVSNQAVSVPFEVAPGNYRLFLFADSGQTVYEAQSEANNVSVARPLAIARTSSDLRVMAVTVTNQALSEEIITVQWRVENTGVASPNASVWSDAVFLSASPVFDTNAVALGAAQNPVTLEPGASYTNALTAALPAEIEGTFYVYTQTDAAGAVIEDGGEGNNTLGATQTLQIALRPVPDLEVVSVTSPAEAYSGQPARFTWTVRNRGAAPAAGEWFDTVHLSADTIFDPADDTLVGYAPRPTSLVGGESYTQTLSLDLPRGVAGLLSVFVVCDGSHRVNERGAETNNVARSENPVAVWLRPPADLVVGTITLPTNIVAGHEIAVSYTLHNQGTNGAFGPWTDNLYLSSDDRWDLDDVLFARVSQTGNLAAGETRSQTLAAPAPGALPGNYHLIVRTDVLNQAPETDESNNLAATLDQTLLEVTPLTLDLPVTDDLVTGRVLYYRVTVPAGQWLVIESATESNTAATELYVRHSAIPSRGEFDWVDQQPLQPAHRIVIPATIGGEYYLLVRAAHVGTPGATRCRTVARLSQFFIFETGFGRGGTAGNLTLEINGVGLDRTCTAVLTNASGLDHPALAHHYEAGARFYPTFDLRGLEAGFYSVLVRNGDGASWLVRDSLEVVETLAPPSVIPRLIAPGAVRRNVAYSFTVDWENTGLNDALPPLITVGNTAPFGLTPGDASLGTRYTFLGCNSHDGPAGILRPGQVESLTFHTRSGSEDGTYFTFATRALKPEDSPYDWDSLWDQLPTEDLPAADAAQAFAELITRTGPTAGDFLAMLSRNISVLPVGLTDGRSPEPALLLEWDRAVATTGTSISGRVLAPDLRVDFNAVSVIASETSSGRARLAPVLLDGSFLFPRLPIGVYELELRGTCLEGAGPVLADLRGGAAIANLIVKATAGATVRGVAYDADTGQGLAGASLCLSGGTTRGASAIAASDGAFRLTGLAGGTYSLTADAPGKARQTINHLVLPAETLLSVDMALSAEARLVGRLTDTSGGGVEAFGVTLWPAGTNANPTVRLAGALGTYSRDGIPAGTYDLAVTASGHASLWLSNVTFTAGATLRLPPLTLERDAVIQGTVRDTRSGKTGPVQIAAYRGGELIAGSPLEADGTYTLEGLAAGTFELAALPLPGNGVSTRTQIAAVAGQTNVAQTLTLYPGAAITGRVTLAAGGEAASGLGVRLVQPDGQMQSVLTHTNGVYAFTGLPAGAYRVSVYPPGVFPDQTVLVTNLDTGIHRVDFALGGAARLEGTVRLASGTPVPEATVSLKAGTNVVATTAADALGRYGFLLQTPGEFSLVANSRSGSFAPLGPVAIAAGETRHQDLTAGSARLEFKATLADGANAPAGHFHLFFVEAQASLIDTFQPGESVVLANLAAGNYRLRIAAEGSLGTSHDLVLTPTDNVSLTPSLLALPELHGQISDGATGLPLANAIVQLLRGTERVPDRTAITGPDGSYAFTALEPGPYSLAAYASGYAAAHRSDQTVQAPMRIDLGLPRPAATIRGRLVSVAGRPIPEAAVALLDAAGLPWGFASTDAEGRFELAAPSPGEVHLWAMAPGFGNATVPLTLTHGGPTEIPDIALIAVAAPVRTTPGLGTALLATAGDGQAGARGRVALASQPGGTSLINEFFALFESLEKSPDHVDPWSFDFPSPECKVGQCLTNYLATGDAVYQQDRSFERAKVLGNYLWGTRAVFYTRCTVLGSGLSLTALGLGWSLGVIGPAVAEMSLIQVATTLPMAKIANDILSEQLINFAADGGTAIAAAPKPETLVDVANDRAEIAYEGAKHFGEWRVSVAEAWKLGSQAAGHPVPMPPNLVDLGKVLGVLEILDAMKKFSKAFGDGAKTLAREWSDIIESRQEYLDRVTAYEFAARKAHETRYKYKRCLRGPCPPPPPPPEDPDSESETRRPVSRDPNDIVGPPGYGPDQWIAPDRTFHYTIRFENDPKKAEAPAQYVRITQTLSPSLDPRTFRLGSLGFGTNLVNVPADRVFLDTSMDVTAGLGVIVRVVAGIDLERGSVTWEFTSLDPATGDLPWDPYVGFLPPNTDGTIGQGFVTYTVKPKPGRSTGEIIPAEARIYFDSNEPLDTPRFFNTVDVGGPNSTVLPLPPVTDDAVFPVRWSGTDGYGGAGLATYTIWVSDNAGPPRVWLADTPQTTALFVGECGHDYQFFSRARDHVGHVEITGPLAQARTLVRPNSPPELAAVADQFIAVGQRFALTNSAVDLDAPRQNLTFSLDPGAPAGMTLDPLTGVLRWVPPCSQGNARHRVTVRVTDDGCGALSASRTFSLAVTECLAIALGRTAGLSGGSACVPLHLESGDALTNLTLTVWAPAGRFTDFSVTPLVPEVATATVTPQSDTQAVVHLTARPGSVLRGPQTLADFCFALRPDQASAFVNLEVTDVLGQRENGTPVGNRFGHPGTVIVIAEEPLLDATSQAPGEATLWLYARPGWRCAIEEASGLGPETVWPEVSRLTSTGLVTAVPVTALQRQTFYRAVRLPSATD